MDKYSTFWSRFVALFLDGLILGVVDVVVDLFLPDPADTSFVVSFVTTNIPYLYAILMIGKYGQTLGKMAMGIKVVDNATEGQIGYYQAFLREAIPMFLVSLSLIVATVILNDADISDLELSPLEYIVLFLPSTMLFIWAILELITMLFDEKNRALHDKIAGTVVIRTGS